MQKLQLKNLPASERPYEKYEEGGASVLSDADLLAIVLRSGTKDKSAIDVARELLSGRQGNLLNLYDYSFEELQRFPGIGRIKAIQLKAVAELARRISRTTSGYRLKMQEPATVADYYMETMRHCSQEQVFCAFFDNSCRFLGDICISTGSVIQTVMPVREILCKALEKHAVHLILLHNHPGGNPDPSDEDRTTTEEFASACKSVGIMLADHIIIGDNCYFSFCESGELRE